MDIDTPPVLQPRKVDTPQFCNLEKLCPESIALRLVGRWRSHGVEETELFSDAGADPRAPALLEGARVPSDGVE